jgi:hypothetical protein
MGSRDSSVGIATGWTTEAEESEFRVPVGTRIFSSTQCPDLPSLLTTGTGALSPGVKRPGHEADHSPPTSAEVKKTRIYTATPPYAFIA